MVARGLTPALLVVLGATAAIAQPPKERPPKLFAVLVADTDSNLKDSLIQDRDNVQRILREAFVTRPNRLDPPTVLDGKDATPKAVLDSLANLKGKVGPRDTVLVYYTGHGATDKDGHYLALRAGKLYRKDVLKAVEDLKPRQTVLLTDCCSKNVETQARGVRVPPPPKATWPVMDFLFFQHSGVTDINGCQADAFSWCYLDVDGKHQGGTFTLALVPLLCQKKTAFGDGTFVTWDQFAKALRDDTGKWFQKARDEYLVAKPDHEIRNQNEQTPHVFRTAKKDEQGFRDNIWLFGAEHTNQTDGKKTSVILLKVYPNTPAAAAGFRERDVVLSVDAVPVPTREDFARALEHSTDGEVRIEFRRGDRTESVGVELKPVKAK